jgi:hypothetical protein
MQGADSPASANTATFSTQYVLYRNDQWHFAHEAPSNVTSEATDIPGGVRVQFMDADGYELFQVPAWHYLDLVVHADGLQLRSPPSDADQGDELDTVHDCAGDTPMSHS